MADLFGNSTCKLDDKNRLTLPSKLLKQLENGSEWSQFIVKPNLDKPCIDLYPRENWDEIMQKLKKLDRFRPDVQEYLIRFLKGHELIYLDKANRLLMPSKLIAYAGIDKEIILAPIIDMIQIWETARYDKYTELPANFNQLANNALDKKDE